MLVWTVGVVERGGAGTLTPVVLGGKGGGLVGVMDLGTARECWSAPGVTRCLGKKGEG